MIFEHPKSISIVERRWQVEIEIVDSSGETHKFIASADSAYTEGDRIWFGTVAEHAEKA